MLFDFHKALRSAIQNNRVFKGIDDDQIRLIVDNGTQQKFAEDEVVVEEGQGSVGLYLVVSGRLEVGLEQRLVEAGLKRASQVHLNTVEPGDCFGEYSLIDGQAASATVRATEAGTLFRISNADFAKIMGSDDLLAKRIYRNLLEVLVQRLRQKDRELDSVLLII